ncbi:MAG: hypothetical protein EON52_12130 [Actinomycetales bacterium]|nr:MAG: hypothetical protein EON52_12130 [Actinomycetales bacterium]
MSEPQTITAEHLRALLSGGSTIGLVEGRVVVLGEGEQDADHARGALEVITRDELVERVGTDPDDGVLAEQAAALTVAAGQLGG